MSRRMIIGWIMVCFFIEGKAQLSVTDVSQMYGAYQTVWYRTKPLLVLNQDKYTPGDTAFFKAYFLMENLTRVPGKQIVNVNLVDDQGQSHVKINFHVNNGLGINQLIIPKNLRAGIYYITAHNNWMKNFDAARIFKKKIVVVNKNEVIEVDQPFLHVAAEGGQLISGVPNTIGVYTNRKGASVQIIDNAGQEVGRANTDDSGTGIIRFIPALGTSYMARVVNDTLAKALPVTQSDGVALQLTPILTDESFRIVLSSAVNSAYEGKELMVLITARGKNHFSTTVKHNHIDSLVVKSFDLPKGLAHLSILDPSGQLLCSRDFYNHRDPIMVKIQPDQTRYRTRQKISLDVTITDQSGKPLEGEFSMDAVNASLFDEGQRDSFEDDLSILSEVKIPYVINRMQETWKNSLDHFLITSTEAMPWATILSKPLPKPVHLFTNVIEKRGKAYFADSNTPLPDLTQISFYLQHNAKYIQTFTMDHGTVGFTIPVFYGDDEFFYMAQLLNQDEITNVRVEWEEDVFPLPKSPMAKEREASDAYAVFMQRKRLIDQSFGVHSQLKELIRTPSETAIDVWEADVTIKADDYVLFPTLTEFIKEVVPAMYYRKTRKGDVVRVKLVSSLPAMSSPLYIIDGIATRNTAFFLSLKPSEIKTMRIINSRERLQASGLLGKYGIVIVESKSGDLREPINTDNNQFKGLNIPLQFNSHNHPANQALIPDFRSTIYWNPSVKTDANGKASIEFYSSDDIGKFNIRVRGITLGAEPFSAEHNVEVAVGLEDR